MARRKAQSDTTAPADRSDPVEREKGAPSASVPDAADAPDPQRDADADASDSEAAELNGDPSFVDDTATAGDPAAAAEAGDVTATEVADVPEPSDAELDVIVEALLFAASDPLTASRLADAAATRSPRRVKAAIDRLRAHYRQDGRSFDVLEIGGGYRLYSRPEFAQWVARLDQVRAPERLSAAALETLAIIAYRQPIIRADIDAVRGVQSGAILKSLLDRKLIRVVGRSDRPGRPLLFGTARRFLDHFGLASVKDLPKVEDLKAP